MREERQRERERQRPNGPSPESPTPVPSSQKEESGIASASGNDNLPSQGDSEGALLGDIEGVSPSLTGEAGGGPVKSGSLVLQTEALLVQMIVRHGEKVMCEVPDGDGEQRPLKVVEFVQYALAQDDLELQDPLHRQILDEALQHYNEEGFRCDRYFENHPDLAVANLANELAHDSETLSRIHEKGIPIKPEEERLMELLPHLIADYKLALVDDEVKTLMQQMRDPAVLSDKAAYIRLIQRYQELKQVQGELGRLRGDRVFA